MIQVPECFAGSKALHYVISKGWQWRQTDNERIELETCPTCKKTGFGHFYMKCEAGSGDGLWICHKCGNSGHLNDLREAVGDAIKGVTDFGSKEKTEEMPDIQQMHEDLLADAEALDYLVNERGFSMEIIKQQRLGVSKRFFRGLGEVKALAYPYLVGQNPVFIHWRSLPPAQKEFSSLKGWDAPLYNGEIIREGLKEITFFEGEANTIAALDHGITDVCGVPGANFKKAMWLEQFDQLGIEKVYICYDKDDVGKRAAQTLASRIGIDKCYKVVLPNFSVPTDAGGNKPGKDLNEWFKYGGGTRELFDQLRASAPKFDVDGVTDIGQGLAELVDKINGKQGMLPKYMMPWSETRAMIGFEDGDILDIIAAEKIGKSIFGMNMMEWFVNEYGEDGVIICLEMTNEQQMKRWVSHVAQVEWKIELDPVKGEEIKQKFLAGIGVALQKHQQRQGNLYFAYPSSKITTFEEFEKYVVDIIRRYGVKFIMVDNIQLLSGRTIKGNDRTQHIDRISKTLQKINKDYGTVMIRIVQPHAIRKGNVVTADDSDGSSQIRKDCDGTIVLNRAPKSEGSMESLKNQQMVVNTDASFERKMRIGVALSRYSAGGECDLDIVGELATVRTYNAATIKMEEVQKKEGILANVEGIEGAFSAGSQTAENIQADISSI